MSSDFERMVKESRQRLDAERSERSSLRANAASIEAKRVQDCAQARLWIPRIVRQLPVGSSIDLVVSTEERRKIGDTRPSRPSLGGINDGLTTAWRYRRRVEKSLQATLAYDNSHAFKGWYMEAGYSEESDEHSIYHDLYLGSDERIYDGRYSSSEYVYVRGGGFPEHRPAVVLQGLANLAARHGLKI